MRLTANGKLVLAGLGLMTAVLLTASAFKMDLGLPTCLAATVITAVVSIKARSNPIRLAREVSWATLLLVAGLFVMVDAVESQGALQLTQRWLAWASHLGQNAGALAIGFVVGVANNIVNNLPLGLIAGGTIQASHTKGLIANAVLIGVDLGPNLSITGSLATILWLLAIRKDSDGVSGGEKLNVSFFKIPESWRRRHASSALRSLRRSNSDEYAIQPIEITGQRLPAVRTPSPGGVTMARFLHAVLYFPDYGQGVEASAGDPS